MFYREWCQQPNQRRGCMLPESVFDTICRAPDAGYCSVYLFDELSTASIKLAKSSAGLAAYPVYTRELIIDLDQGLPQLDRAREALALRSLGYKIYESGGKGYHVVIELATMISGTNVPYSQRKWVETLDVGADLSLYQAGHIISLPGRRHPKTGKRKQLIDTVSGAVLNQPLLSPLVVDFTALASDDKSQLETAFWKLLSLTVAAPAVGARHVSLWAAAKQLAAAGLDYDTTLDLLQQVNSTWDDQKKTEEVTLAVSKAYSRK